MTTTRRAPDLAEPDEWRREPPKEPLLESVRRRPAARRALQALSVALLLTGLAVFAYPFATNWYADWRQQGLQTEFRSADTERRFVTQTVQPGDALTRIVIPELGLDTIVVEGTAGSALRAGAGHYEGTALPCEDGNAAIAGHRTTYSKPFARVDQLAPGDEITLETPLGRCRYRVTDEPFIVPPDATWVLGETTAGVLTLTTCHPPGSDTERLVVRARLVEA